MAYTTSSNLLTASQTNGASVSPYAVISVVTVEGSAAVAYDVDDRLVYLRVHEEVWDGNAEIWLRNDDNALDALNYHGRRVHFEFGYNTAGGDESIKRPDQWIVRQTFQNQEGRAYLILYCVSIWTILGYQNSGGDAVGAAPAFNIGSFTDTIQEICENLLARVKIAGYASGIGLSTQVGNLDVFTPQTETSPRTKGYDGGSGGVSGGSAIFSSGVFKEYEPQVLVDWTSPIRGVLRNLLTLTEVRLQPSQGSAGDVAGLNFRARWLNPSESADWTIESSGTSNVLYRYRNMADSLVIPNKVIYAQTEVDADQSSTVWAMKTNAASVSRIGALGTTILYPQDGTEIGNQTSTISLIDECDLRAQRAMFAIEAEVYQGEITMRPHVGFEIFDKVTVNDTRWGTSSFTSRIGMIEMVLDQRPGVSDNEWDRYYADVAFGV